MVAADDDFREIDRLVLVARGLHDWCAQQVNTWRLVAVLCIHVLESADHSEVRLAAVQLLLALLPRHILDHLDLEAQCLAQVVRQVTAEERRVVRHERRDAQPHCLTCLGPTAVDRRAIGGAGSCGRVNSAATGSPWVLGLPKWAPLQATGLWVAMAQSNAEGRGGSMYPHSAAAAKTRSTPPPTQVPIQSWQHRP